MSVTDELIANNATYVASFDHGELPLPPGRKVAVVACMDARLNVYGALGLTEGDAHVIRNAGGVVTDDEIRSLAISQRLLGTEEIILIHHTDCGMLTFTDDQFKADSKRSWGSSPSGPPRRSATSTRTCANRWPASTPVRSSRARRACAGSCTTSRPGNCAKCSDRCLGRVVRQRSALCTTSPRRAMRSMRSP